MTGGSVGSVAERQGSMAKSRVSPWQRNGELAGGRRWAGGDGGVGVAWRAGGGQPTSAYADA